MKTLSFVVFLTWKYIPQWVLQYLTAIYYAIDFTQLSDAYMYWWTESSSRATMALYLFVFSPLYAIADSSFDNPSAICNSNSPVYHDDVIKWKHFPRNWPFVRGIHQSPVNSPHKGQWRGALMFSFICFWIKDWVKNRKTGDLRHCRAHYCVIVMDNPSAKCNSNFLAYSGVFIEENILEIIIYFLHLGLWKADLDA